MKKIILVLILFFNFSSFTLSEEYFIGQKIEYEFILDNKMRVELSPGKWEIVEKEVWRYNAFSGRWLRAVKTDENKIVETITLGYLSTQGKRIADINTYLYEIIFKNKYDGCYKRPEYTKLYLYHKGSTVNCMRVAHVDTNKELYNPDDKELAYLDANFIRWIENKSVEVPRIALGSSHAFFDRTSSQKFYTIARAISPEFFDGPKTKYKTEDNSEYHPSNIMDFPEHKKNMENFIKEASYFHQNLEEKLNLKDIKRIKFSELESNKKNNQNNENSDIADQIKKLNELYKSGVLTKQEFDKAKKRILE